MAASTKHLPRTAREWVVYRAGIREGIELAQRDAREKADQFMTRALCGGVEFAVPSADAAEQLAERDEDAA
jgi:hypothetical protein